MLLCTLLFPYVQGLAKTFNPKQLEKLESVQEGRMYEVASANFAQWGIDKLKSASTCLDNYLKEQMTACTMHSQKVNTFQEYDFENQVNQK